MPVLYLEVFLDKGSRLSLFILKDRTLSPSPFLELGIQYNDDTCLYTYCTNICQCNEICGIPRVRFYRVPPSEEYIILYFHNINSTQIICGDDENRLRTGVFIHTKYTYY